MENKNFKFKTNINCSACEAKVTPFLNILNSDWNVDTTNKDKILTIESEGIIEQEVIDAVQKAGFKIEPLN